MRYIKPVTCWLPLHCYFLVRGLQLNTLFVVVKTYQGNYQGAIQYPYCDMSEFLVTIVTILDISRIAQTHCWLLYYNNHKLTSIHTTNFTIDQSCEPSPVLVFIFRRQFIMWFFWSYTTVYIMGTTNPIALECLNTINTMTFISCSTGALNIYIATSTS